jgi:hypothetical protein
LSNQGVLVTTLQSRRAYAALACGAFVLAVARVTSAQLVQAPLTDFLPGGAQSGGIVVTDPLSPAYGWRYSDFTFRSTGGAPVDAGSVVVRTSGDNSIGRGSLAFTYAKDVAPADAAKPVAFELGYRTDVIGPDPLNRVGLRFNGSVPSQGPGNATATVLATFSSLDGSLITIGGTPSPSVDLNVYNDGPARLEDRNSDFASLAALRGIRVVNFVTATPRAGGGPVSVSVADSYLTIPEPASAALVATGAGALLLRRRRYAGV